MKASVKYFLYNLLSKILPKQFCRVSIKALIWNADKTKFLLLQEVNGYWETPGGGLDWGENPLDGLKREIVEETGFDVISISPSPICFVTAQHHRFDGWFANVVYEVTVKDVSNPKINDECVATGWFTSDEAMQLAPAYRSVRILGEALKKLNT